MSLLITWLALTIMALIGDALQLRLARSALQTALATSAIRLSQTVQWPSRAASQQYWQWVQQSVGPGLVVVPTQLVWYPIPTPHGWQWTIRAIGTATLSSQWAPIPGFPDHVSASYP
ncbi:MAG: hypothetical protein K6U14_12285 [Firmicutes bacterium]|nr:hypothetical protein [Alicyclobacillaceae bacterium]MCL6498389.1 hypothetical protein [Bacillota bacterium]